MTTETNNNDGTTIWIADTTDNTVYVYSPRYAIADSYPDPALYDETFTGKYRYDGTTIWVPYNPEDKVYAYIEHDNGKSE